MGNWRITIEGMGMHHNGSKAIMKDGSVKYGGVSSELIDQIDHWEATQPNDADRLWRAFMETLKTAGHQINTGTFEVLNQVEYK